MKILKVKCGKKQPIPGVQFSSIEAYGSATLEFNENEKSEEEVFKELEESLNNALFHSIKVAEEASFGEIYEKYEKMKERYELLINFIKDKNLANDFKTYKEQR